VKEAIVAYVAKRTEEIGAHEHGPRDRALRRIMNARMYAVTPRGRGGLA
jgi:hypothetical protein